MNTNNKKCNVKECLFRAGRTFLQSVIGYLAVHLSGFAGNSDITKSAVEGLLISAVAAGLAAVMNLPKKDSSGENTDEAEDDKNGKDV